MEKDIPKNSDINSICDEAEDILNQLETDRQSSFMKLYDELSNCFIKIGNLVYENGEGLRKKMDEIFYKHKDNLKFWSKLVGRFECDNNSEITDAEFKKAISGYRELFKEWRDVRQEETATDLAEKAREGTTDTLH